MVVWCLVTSILVLAAPSVPAGAQAGGGCVSELVLEVPGERASEMGWLFLDPGDSIEMTAISTLGLRRSYSDWNINVDLWRYDFGGFPGTDISDRGFTVYGWTDPPTPKERTITLRNNNTTPMVVLELSYGFERVDLDQDGETKITNFEIVHADGSRSGACVHAHDPGERPPSTCFGGPTIGVGETGEVRSEPFDLSPNQWITMKILDERALRVIDGELGVFGTWGDWNIQGALVEPGAEVNWTDPSSPDYPIDRDTENSELVWSRRAYFDGRIQLKNSSDLETVQLVLRISYARSGDENDPWRAWSSVHSVVNGEFLCLESNVSTPGWALQPSCAFDTTAEISAGITNPSDQPASYRIVVSNPDTGDDVHGAAPTTLDPGGTANLVLRGIPDGRWKVTVMQDGVALQPSRIFDFDHDYLCLQDRGPGINWDHSMTCVADGTVAVGVNVTNNRTTSQDYRIEVLDPATLQPVHGSHAVSIESRDTGRILLSGKSPGNVVVQVLEAGVAVEPARPYVLTPCAAGGADGEATIGSANCGLGSIAVEFTSTGTTSQAAEVRLERPDGSLVHGGTWPLPAGATDTFTLTGIPFGTYLVKAILAGTVVAEESSVEIVECGAVPVTGLTVRYETGWPTAEGPHMVATWTGESPQHELRWYHDQTAAQIEAADFANQFSTVTLNGNTFQIAPDAPGPISERWCVAVRGLGEADASEWSGPACAITLQCAEQMVTVMVGRGETASDGDDVILGTNNADEIYAFDGDDVVCARAGNDEIVGGAGADIIYASSGHDEVFGGPGGDRIYGSDGNDSLQGGFGVDFLNGGNGNDDLFGDEGDDTLLGYRGEDTLYGGEGNDYLGGHSHTDELWGGPGNDRLYGHGDADFLYGELGDDKLYGAAGDDTMFGDAGRDQVYGGPGEDVLFGGAEDDELFGQDANDVLFGGTGDDYGNGGSGIDQCLEIEELFRCVNGDLDPCFLNVQNLSALSAEVFNAAQRAQHTSVSPQHMRSGCNNVPVSNGIFLGGPAIFAGVRDMIAEANTEVIVQFFVFEMDSEASFEIARGVQAAIANLPAGERLIVKLVTDSRFDAEDIFNQPEWSSIDLDRIEFHYLLNEAEINNVMHDKVVIVDGRSVMVTGANPQAQQQGPGAWYDIGVRIDGPVALSALENFEDMWEQGNSLHRLCGNSQPLFCSLQSVAVSETPWEAFHAEVEGTTIAVALPRSDGFGIPAVDDTNNPQDRAWEAVFAHAPVGSTISIMSPNINDNNFIDGVVEASERGVNIELMTSFGFNETRNDILFQGGRNCEIVSELLERSDTDHLTIKWYSLDGVTWIDGNGDHASHAKFMAVSDPSGNGVLVIVGSGNHDTQAWDSSHEYNVMLDGPEITNRLMGEAFDPVWNTGIVGNIGDCPD